LFQTLRSLGAVDLSVGRIFEGHVNAALLVNRFGTAEQYSSMKEAVKAGALSGVWGADGQSPLKAELGKHGWSLTGQKILCSGAGRLTLPLVVANANEAQVLFLVPLKPGERTDLSRWQSQGMRSSATGTVDLTGIVLPQDCMIGEPGDFTRQPYFSGGAWRFCAVQLGAIEQLVDLFRGELRKRGREADPFQLQRLAEATSLALTARFWCEEAANNLENESGQSDVIVAFSNLTRMVTERAALGVLEIVHRGVGLAGFIRPSSIERISRDLSTYLRQPAPDAAMIAAAQTIAASRRSTADMWMQ
jgi:alkylation response protein AidB-like acyl-CoA dehydrogenase